MKPNKPRIRISLFRRGRWVCMGGDRLGCGYGLTPVEAYNSWLDRVQA